MADRGELTPLDDNDFTRVLCVVAHPDDMEYGASAAVATWTRAGKQVGYLLLTGGEAGMAEDPEQVRTVRAEEQRRACATVGVTDLTILRHPDGMLQPGLELRKDIARQIRMFRPDVVLTANFHVEAYGGLNQADHRVTGIAVIDATRDAANRWVFRDLAETEHLGPWQATLLLVTGDENPNLAQPVDQRAVDAAVTSLQCHQAYLRHLPDHPDPEVFIPEELRKGGEAAGTDYAVLFRGYQL
ncbi:PIG-L deacetylase family protein [Nakamurella aerolata]|uniref:PIG-L family deacetylase n=1 Tax=Nakamurella aerolata TaxID=1656892 RepID=A0A849ADK8_9ACTN|nr:PIG-L deacetylase family protein [Nakamurella aerolata]NNG37268.1 PIG-L family deacetylase [Nakamurella aerolata]